ncbi:hypothetical protein QR680_006085 [Steinernema hermaphroditum]|uniref:Uncharacterized protein n=1 Tax=Steinernema hermaphroditum TaxID=289476 RepID=A0AA39HVM0_9BILA|nr:hypothetical protein QR680_006085 [Steinernema hermaphroditum]
MPVMNSVEKIICSFILIPNIIINVLIIYLSICHVKRSILQIFALNLCIPTLCYLLYASGALLSSLIWPSKDVALGIKLEKTKFSDYLSTVIGYICGFNYRVLAIFLVSITYCFFAKPLFSKKRLTNKNVLFVLFGCHVFTITTSTIATFSNRQSKQVMSELFPIAAVNWLDIVEGSFETSSLSFCIFMYFVCIGAVMAFRKTSSNAFNNRQKRRVQLIATLAYITPPNILLLPNSICTDLFAALFGSPPVFKQFCEMKIYHDDSLLQGRLFVTTFTVLVAFVDYRRALKQLIRKGVMCLPMFKQQNKLITSLSFVFDSTERLLKLYASCRESDERAETKNHDVTDRRRSDLSQP